VVEQTSRFNRGNVSGRSAEVVAALHRHPLANRPPALVETGNEAAAIGGESLATPPCVTFGTLKQVHLVYGHSEDGTSWGWIAQANVGRFPRPA
jgi:hypothetical protein